jgi:hypothetical protein
MFDMSIVAVPCAAIGLVSLSIPFQCFDIIHPLHTIASYVTPQIYMAIMSYYLLPDHPGYTTYDMQSQTHDPNNELGNVANNEGARVSFIAGGKGGVLQYDYRSFPFDDIS